MQYKFSEELKIRLNAYFKSNYSLEISNETADEWLDLLAGLYLSFNEMSNNSNLL